MNTVVKFTNLESAESFVAHSVKPKMIVLGDDNKYWVCSFKVASELEKQGFQIA